MYSAPHQFEPLMPSHIQLERLLPLAHEFRDATSALGSLSGAPILRGVMHRVSAFYSNQMEGQEASPQEINAVLAGEASSDASTAARQRLAFAHVNAELVLEHKVQSHPGETVHRDAFSAQRVHALLFAHLTPADKLALGMNDVQPGELRKVEVRVGQHVAPAATAVSSFLDRWNAFYGVQREAGMDIIALICSHQRLGWVHPFGDGNGRTMRLHSRTGLLSLGYAPCLWSPNRAFARTKDRYLKLLAEADSPRRGALDGRGNLSESALVAWVTYVLEAFTEEARSMYGLLEARPPQDRLRECISAAVDGADAMAVSNNVAALEALFEFGGDISRELLVSRLYGSMDVATVDKVLCSLEAAGLIKVDPAGGPLCFALPLACMRSVLPGLWPEAEQ